MTPTLGLLLLCHWTGAGQKRSRVIVRLTTISPSPCSASASEEFTDLAAACLADYTWAWGFLMGLWSARLWETISAKASLTGINDSILAIWGPKS